MFGSKIGYFFRICQLGFVYLNINPQTSYIILKIELIFVIIKFEITSYTLCNCILCEFCLCIYTLMYICQNKGKYKL